MDSNNDTNQDIDTSRPSGISVNTLNKSGNGNAQCSEEDRRLLHGMLYGNEIDTDTNTLQHQQPSAATHTSIGDRSHKQNTASSKQIVMSRCATSENCTAINDIQSSAGIGGAASNLERSAKNVYSATGSSAQRPPSGIGIEAISPVGTQSRVNSTATVETPIISSDPNHIQLYSQQHCFENSQIVVSGQSNQDRYHNRHATHLYGGASTINQQNIQHHNQALGSTNYREQSSSSATNLLPKQSPNGPGSILANAGQYASQAISSNQHHIPIRNTTTGQLLMQGPQQNVLINRGSSQQSNHHPSQSSQQTSTLTNGAALAGQSTLSQQQIQQQQYKTAKTQMYEKMLIQQQQFSGNPDKKQLMFSQSGNTATAFNQTQLSAANALSSQQQFLNNQALNNQQQAANLIFPRISNVRNENSATIYKTTSQQPIAQQMLAATTIGNAMHMANYNYIQQQQQSNQSSNLQSPFIQGNKVAMPSPGQTNALSIMANNNFAKKKTVSPRNTSSVFSNNQGSAIGGPKMLLMADKNQQILDSAHGKPLSHPAQQSDEYKMSIVEPSGQQSDHKNRNRMISSHNQNVAPKEFNDFQDVTHLKLGANHYNTEKINHQLLNGSDSNSALATVKLNSADDTKASAAIGKSANQFFCGEMSINNDHHSRKIPTADDPSSLYQHQAVTPSIMSSHSNKRQSHHINMYNPGQQALIQHQIQNQQLNGDQQQQQPQMAHNFFSRRTVSQKDNSNNGQSSFKIPHSQPLNQQSKNNELQLHQYHNQHSDVLPAQGSYPFSPQGGQMTQQTRGMTVDGSAMSSGPPTDPIRIKYGGSSVNNAGIPTRSSLDGSPMKNQLPSATLAITDGSSSQPITTQDGQQSSSGSAATGQDGQQQAVKIPVICGFHKRVLLLTSQIQNQPGGLNGLPITGGPQAQQQRESVNKKIRNRNPNCNHNNNSVFYAPCYNNVKYDDSYKKKEEVLRKVFFKECAKEDDKRISQQQYFPPNGQNPNALNKNDPFSYLKPIENFLIQTLFIDYDIQQANKQNPGNVPLRPPFTATNLFMELGLETAIVAHKAFLLALIQSGKITNENMLKVLHEFKASAQEFDHECIYCKYSQYALRESTKVIKNSLKAAASDPQNPEYEAANRQLQFIGHPQMQQHQLLQMGDALQQDPRIEYLIRMFQSQLFKRSFINTSLMIIQRKMNEKLLQKQKLPPGISGQQNGQQQAQLLDANGKPKKLLKPDIKKPQQPPMSSLEWIGSQIQKLAKNLSNPKDKDKYLEFKEKYYREFLMQINKSNNAIIPFPKATFTPYKYYIGRGNNSILVRNCLKQRFWWSMGDFEDWDEYNFIWTQWKANKIVAKIKTNQEVQAAITAENQKSGVQGKDGNGGVGTSESMLSTDRDSNSSAETLLATPTKRKRVATALLTQSQGITAIANSANNNNSLAIKKNTSASKSNVLQKPGTQTAGQVAVQNEDSKKETSHSIITYNHMENNYHLSNKKALYYNMKIYYESIGQDWFSVLPLTFHIKEGSNDKEFIRFMELFKDYDSGKAQGAFEKLGKQIWIVKPGENTNRGCGIQVCRELSQIKEIVSNTNVNGQKRSYIIQKYIEKPLLYKNRKFDIRCYTLLTTVNGNLQGYWYNEGYLRTSSKDFNLKNVTNRLIHLTNDAVQKRSDDYGKFESGNKLSYPDFQKYLDSIDIKCNIVKEIVPQLKKIAADTIKACSRKVDPHRRHNTFEIFGYDFMIDEDMKPWLIEVNTNPCLELSAPYLSRLIPAMIENAVKIAIDPLFPPPPWPNAKKHTIPDCMENNKFELVFNELTDSAELKNLPIDDGAMNGIIEEEEMEDEGSDNDAGDEEEIN